MRGTATIIAGLALLGLTGCDEHGIATGAPLAGGAVAMATLHTADGTEVGRATATEVAGGVRFALDTHGMPPGTHGARVHTVGHCDPAGVATAGGRWNPTGMTHGSMNPQGP